MERNEKTLWFKMKPGQEIKILGDPNKRPLHWRPHCLATKVVVPCSACNAGIKAKPVHVHILWDKLKGKVITYGGEDCSICEAIRVALGPWWKRVLRYAYTLSRVLVILAWRRITRQAKENKGEKSEKS